MIIYSVCNKFRDSGIQGFRVLGVREEKQESQKLTLKPVL